MTVEEKKVLAPTAQTIEQTTQEATPDERAYVVMGGLLLRAVERTGVVVTEDDRLFVEETMRALAQAMTTGNLCLGLSGEACKKLERLHFAFSGDRFPRDSLSDDLRSIFATTDSVSAPFVYDKKGRLYPHRFFLEELTLAQRFCRLATIPERPLTPAQEKLLAHMAESDRVWVASNIAPEVSDAVRSRLLEEALLSETEQRAAVTAAVTKCFTVVCGGPGTGKTTSVVKMLLLLFLESPDMRVALAAPTGKATSRMMQSVSDGLRRYAKLFETVADEKGVRLTVEDLVPRIQEHTIHKWLTMPVSGASRPSSEAPLETDVLVVDEASMIDVGLASRLMDAIDPERTRLIVLGDPRQLAAVGPGAVYADLADENGALIASRAFLTVSRRYGATSPVGRLARAVNDSGTDDATLLALWDENAGKVSARIQAGGEYVRFAPAIGRAAEPSRSLLTWMHRQLKPFVERVRAMLVDEFTSEADYEAKAAAVWRSLSHFRVLAAQRSGRAGVTVLNERATASVRTTLGCDGDFFPGYVLIVRNNDDTLGLFNGDVGVCLPDRENPSHTIVWFGDKGESRKLCAYEAGLLPQFDTAYAMTIHQSQGSEFEEVAIVLPENADSGLATRELLYTGVTRAKRGATVFGTKAVYLKAARTPTEREGGLGDRLREFKAAQKRKA